MRTATHPYRGIILHVQDIGCHNNYNSGTSTKFENNDHLFSAALRLNAFVKNAVAFL